MYSFISSFTQPNVHEIHPCCCMTQQLIFHGRIAFHCWNTPQCIPCLLIGIWVASPFYFEEFCEHLYTCSFVGICTHFSWAFIQEWNFQFIRNFQFLSFQFMLNTIDCQWIRTSHPCQCLLSSILLTILVGCGGQPGRGHPGGATPGHVLISQDLLKCMKPPKAMSSQCP